MAIGRQMKNAALTAAHSPGLTITRLGATPSSRGRSRRGWSAKLTAKRHYALALRKTTGTYS